MSEWPTVTLHDAGVSLLDCDHKTPKAQEFGLPYIGIPQLKEGRITLNGARLISEEDFTHWRRKSKPTQDDVILSRRCNPGETAFVPEGLYIALGQNLVLLRADGDRVYPPFLRWLVKSPNWWHQVDKYINVGAIFDSLRCADIPKFEIKLPPLETQVEIEKLLKTLDMKIELNHQTNQTLEQIAQAIFKSWFVEFEPVKAKQHIHALGGNNEQTERAAQAVIAGAVNLNVITTATDLSTLDQQLTQALGEKLAHQREAQCEQLADTARQFPDRLVESELGLIPEGWEVRSLDSIADFLNGVAAQKYPVKNDETGLPVIKIAEIRNGYSAKTGLATLDVDNKYIVENGDLLFSWSGSLMVKQWGLGHGLLNQHIFKVSSMEFPKWFYFHWISRHLREFQRIAADKAVTMGHIKRSHLNEAKTVVPTSELLNIGSDTLGAMLEQELQHSREIERLKELRDLLLPRLLSGELTVGQSAVLGMTTNG